jgi:hypothetical protein
MMSGDVIRFVKHLMAAIGAVECYTAGVVLETLLDPDTITKE